jgi:hypothetical protein
MINTGRLLETPAVALIFIGALAASCINTHAVAVPHERVLAAQENAEAAGGVDTLATIRPKDGILLGAEPLRVAFTPSEGLSIQDFASRVRELAGNHEFYVVFDGLSVAAPPEVVYSIYLTAGANEDFHGASDPRYVGALHFFGAFDAGARPGKSMAFNVTELIRNLTKTGFETQPLSLWILPSAEPEKSANPRVAGIRLVAAR